MKKVVYFLAVSFLLGSLLSSCKSHERCPAYGSIENTKSDKSI